MSLPYTAWRWAFLALLLPVSFVLWACSPYTTPGPPVVLRVGVCTSLRPLLDLVSRGYSESSGASIVVTEGSERFILRLMEEGALDVALLATEEGPNPRLVAKEALAVVVHPSNPVSTLSLSELRSLYGGYVLDWADLGGAGEVVLVVREDGSAARSLFEGKVMQGERVSPTAVVMPSSQDVLEYVSLHPGAVGYVSAGYLGKGVKTLALEGVAPSPSSVASGKYPLIFPAYAVGLSKAGENLVEFLTGPAGRSLIRGRYALP